LKGLAGNEPLGQSFLKQMSNPMQMWNAWLRLSSQAALLGLESQSVVALRMMRFAGGGAGSQAEAQRMAAEKFSAFAEAQAAAAAAVMGSGANHDAGKKVLAVYRRRVRRNRRRLINAAAGRARNKR
jgi:hypothetical protein